MLYKDEVKILKALKLAPFFMIAFSIIVIVAIVKNNNLEFEREVNKIRQESIAEKKAQIKREVQRVHSFVSNQKQQTIQNIKDDLQQRVYEAHVIASAIYKRNQNRPKAETKELIKEALRNIRFNKGRGYFYIYETQGVNVLHPILPNLEGKNLWETKDVKGNHAVQNMSNIAREKGEGFAKWWWQKPSDVANHYEKIGFGKYFAPYDWFIGSGDYVLDYEEELQQSLLSYIKDIRYEDDGYIFVVDNQGIFLSHINEAYLNQKPTDLKGDNSPYVTQAFVKAGQEGEKYLTYSGFVEPSTGKVGDKLSFIKGFEDWQWAIGTGTYLREIEEVIANKKQALDENNNNKILQITLLSLIMSAALFILTLLFANNIKKRFQTYKTRVEEETAKLDLLNKNLEQEVTKRTEQLEETIDSLRNTQSQLVESEKMASLGGLVAGVAHEINTPIGIGLTGITHLVDITKEIKSEYANQEMSAESFESYIESTEELGQIININLNRTADLIKSFKQISVDQTNEEMRRFNVKGYLKEVLLSLKSVTKKARVDIKLNCDKQIMVTSYPGALSQIMTNLIINSVKHGFIGRDNNLINIDIALRGTLLAIDYQDNGIGIPKQNSSKIFEPFFTTNRDQGGTGLGLNIIYNIVTTNLKGTIEYKQESSHGVHFVICIPSQ